MARARLVGLAKRFGDTAALAALDLDVEDGELVTVLGPSGCGKSTLLRLIAGLEPPDAGEIRLDGERIDRLPPGKRDVAMVFQSYALYPHMSVRANVEFPLRMRGVERDARKQRIAEIAALLELVPLLDRLPAALSGGERQRVALARALVRRPKLFLLDEPLSNLDARLRAHVRRFFHDLQRRLGVTTLYVTHDQSEAMTLGDRVVVLEAGRVQQVAPPVELYERPANRFVAGFVGAPPLNLLPATSDGGVLRVADQTIVPEPALRAGLASSADELTVGVRPEDFGPATAAAGEDTLVAVPEPGSREFLGGETILTARVGEAKVLVRLFGNAPLPERVAAPAASLHVFDRAGRRIGP
jgi:ABC-type sugar transport system ATPase subunit